MNAIAFDPGIFRPQPAPQGILRTAHRVARPKEFIHGMPVMESAVIFRAAFDSEAGVYVVSRYPDTGEGITFEAGTMAEAFARAEQIVPDIFEARGLPSDAIGIIIDEYDNPAVFAA